MSKKKKVKYKIISVNTASPDAGISTKILKDAINANSKWSLIEIDGETQTEVYHSNSRKDCEIEEKRLKKLKR